MNKAGKLHPRAKEDQNWTGDGTQNWTGDGTQNWTRNLVNIFFLFLSQQIYKPGSQVTDLSKKKLLSGPLPD